MENCPSLKCFYGILGVQKGSSEAEIRTAYRKLAMRWHPDKCLNAKGDAKLKFQVVQEAYSVLSDEHKRVLYDSGLYNAGDDPDSLGELVSLMKVACQKAASTKKSTADLEFQKLKKHLVNKDNVDRVLQHFRSATRSCPRQEQPTNMEHNQPPLGGATPKPHPNLFAAMGCSDISFGSDFALETGRYTFEFEQPSTPCPQPHPNLSKGTTFYDSIPETQELLDYASETFFCDSIQETQELLDYAAEQFGFSAVHDSHSTPAQGSANPSQISERSSQINFASVSEACTTEKSCTPGGATVPPNINSQGFCMGVSEDGAGKDYRALGKCIKSRRKKMQR